MRPDRSEFCPSTGASSATNSPAIAVEIARAVDVALVAPKLSLVMYTEKTNVVMTVLNGWLPQSHIPHARILRREVGPATSRAVGPAASMASAGAVGVVTALTVAIWWSRGNAQHGK